MRQLLAFLTILVLYSCRQQSEPAKTSPNGTLLDSSAISTDLITDEKENNKTTEKQFDDWGKYQDALRNEILKGKKNKILKESFLQEMYIRNVVTISNDSVLVNIPFNIHEPDCGAPDAYSTDIHFSFKLDDKLLFPKKLSFTEYEHGCVDQERKLSGSFELLEETPNEVIYYSTQYKRTLVLFRSNKENGTTAFYFTGLGKNKINRQNVYTIIQEYNDEDENSIYPFTSWVLTTNEYENFIR
ncbi:hypothetical protein GOQ30_01090 [Flavobacterium sp. TP390]|uniref:Lipoprotein n=1 Tax=Flavobacterium profundi TaxID=1774945 RepID=A0A6I4IDV7_9FLAO|nr:hypothetical protein [Flavobacterium profundi]MVO07755.1 hypothetical protein [Flavobacterium profundi]